MTGDLIVRWLRRALLELWAMFVIAVVVGFLGPFGTYLDSSVMDRVTQWWQLLMGAYLFVRPWIFILQWIARVTWLPSSVLVLWGVVFTSVPLAMLWRRVGQDAYRELDGYAGLVPFALLCALAVLSVEWWATQAEKRLSANRSFTGPDGSVGETQQSNGQPDTPIVHVSASDRSEDRSGEPKLRSRLAPSFEGPIIALQSEDHYVRVHGMHGSELILIRLRDAIAEMTGVPGEQVHRSWWLARSGVVALEQVGRNWVMRLHNGQTAPVARDLAERLRRSGFCGTTFDRK